MPEDRTKRVSCLLTPDQHAAFKIACIRLGVTIDQCLTDAVLETITIASLQKGDGDESTHGSGST